MFSKIRSRLLIALMVLALIGFAPRVFAQAIDGNLTGTVLDPTGASVPNASRTSWRSGLDSPGDHDAMRSVAESRTPRLTPGAMPSRTAGKLCPHGIFVRPRMDAYRAESAAIMEILGSVTPVIAAANDASRAGSA